MATTQEETNISEESASEVKPVSDTAKPSRDAEAVAEESDSSSDRPTLKSPDKGTAPAGAHHRHHHHHHHHHHRHKASGLQTQAVEGFKQTPEAKTNSSKFDMPPVNVDQLATMMKGSSAISQGMLEAVRERMMTRGEDSSSDDGSTKASPGMLNLFDCIVEVTLQRPDSDLSDEDEDSVSSEIPCQFCSKMFESNMRLKTHVLIAHSNEDPSVLNVKCRSINEDQKTIKDLPSRRKRSKGSSKSDCDATETAESHKTGTKPPRGQGVFPPSAVPLKRDDKTASDFRQEDAPGVRPGKRRSSRLPRSDKEMPAPATSSRRKRKVAGDGDLADDEEEELASIDGIKDSEKTASQISPGKRRKRIAKSSGDGADITERNQRRSTRSSSLDVSRNKNDGMDPAEKKGRDKRSSASNAKVSPTPPPGGRNKRSAVAAGPGAGVSPKGKKFLRSSR